MDKIDTEIRFAGMAEERLRREDPHYRVWSFTDDDDVTALYLGRVDMNGGAGGTVRPDTYDSRIRWRQGVCEMAWRTLFEAAALPKRGSTC